jgi:hypothetical protein
MNQPVLFHGSMIEGIKILEPRGESRPECMPDAPLAVYAGDDPAYCAAHAFPGDTANGEIGLDYFGSWVNGKPVWGPFTLTIPSKRASDLELPVSIYKVPISAFEPLPEVPPHGRNFWSLKSVAVLEELRFPSIIKAIENFSGKIVIK